MASFYSLDRIHMADEAEIYPRHDSECWYEDTSLTDETRATNIGSHIVVCTFRGLGSFTRGRDCDYNTVSLEGKKRFFLLEFLVCSITLVTYAMVLS